MVAYHRGALVGRRLFFHTAAFLLCVLHWPSTSIGSSSNANTNAVGSSPSGSGLLMITALEVQAFSGEAGADDAPFGVEGKAEVPGGGGGGGGGGVGSGGGGFEGVRRSIPTRANTGGRGGMGMIDRELSSAVPDREARRRNARAVGADDNAGTTAAEAAAAAAAAAAVATTGRNGDDSRSGAQAPPVPISNPRRPRSADAIENNESEEGVQRRGVAVDIVSKPNLRVGEDRGGEEDRAQQQQQQQQQQLQGRRQLSGDREEAESEQEARQTGINTVATASQAAGRNSQGGGGREPPQGDAAAAAAAAATAATTNYRPSRALNSQGGEGHGSSDGEEKGTGREDGMVEFRLDGRVETLMAGDAMRDYLNRLVEETVGDTENQTCNVAFVKTHKTASTTLATILFRYGKRHGLRVANFDGHQSSISLPEAVRQVEAAGEPVDVMHYHHAWDGFYDGGWGEAKAAYRKIMREPSDVKLVTVMREPVGHYLSYYYYFLQPETGLSVAEYFEVSKKPKDPRYEKTFLKQRDGSLGWHGFKLLHNPLCAEFGIRNIKQLEAFIEDDLPGFAMILLTEQFEESLAIFMRMFNWRPIDMTYCKVIETKAGVARYDGKMLTNVPKIKDLPLEVLSEIRRQTQLDLALYKAAVKVYREKKIMFGKNLEVDVRAIRTAQSAVHGYLDYNATSLAHGWYEGDVKCFANPSPMQPF